MLASLQAERILPGHGRVSTEYNADVERAIQRLELLLGESKMLFEAMRHSQDSFEQTLRSLRNLKL